MIDYLEKKAGTRKKKAIKKGKQVISPLPPSIETF
jgi:hypothetical protein